MCAPRLVAALMSGLRTRMPLVFLSTAVPNRTVFEVMVDVEAMPPRTYDEVFLGSDASTGWIYCLTVRHANDVSPRWTCDCHAFAGRLWRTRAVSASLELRTAQGDSQELAHKIWMASS